ncbi:MAG TPA: M20/M25/M40 family metallo-hydrolase [Thermoanaerobaculia bacterium]
MRSRDAIIVAFILVVILAATALRLDGPAPGELARDADNVLKSLLREGLPHPSGSPANRVVRDRILARFRELGYAPAIQRAYACGPRSHRCATVENIVVLPPVQGDIVLGVAHYDSVPAGPGASDDGAGVATILECARNLRGGFRNPIGFLITDGEELGLVGAQAFVNDQALSRNVRAVVNVEDRGTSGPSFLFETSRDNRDLAPLFRDLPRPNTSSLFYTVYELMPNDTDVTVFKRAGKIAVNFAAIGGVENYHHASDDLAHVDVRTLEHHCENALPMIRALASADLRSLRHGNAVFFDVLGLFLVSWPEQWTIWIALASFVLLIVLMRSVPARDTLISALMFLGAIACAAAIGIVAMVVLPHRLAHPVPAVAAMWTVGVACAVLLTRNRAWQGRSLVWHVAAIALALTLPGVSFLFLLPALAMHVPARPFVAAAVAALLFFPLGLVLYTALAALALPAIAVLMAIFGSTVTK